MADINIEQSVKEIIATQLAVEVGTVKLESKLAEDLGMDSFGAVELAFALEDKFGIKISDDAIYTAKTVQDIVSYISSQTTQK